MPAINHAHGNNDKEAIKRTELFAWKKNKHLPVCPFLVKTLEQHDTNRWQFWIYLNVFHVELKCGLTADKPKQPYIYGHIKLPVVAATIYIYAHDKFVRFPREAKKLNEIWG